MNKEQRIKKVRKGFKATMKCVISHKGKIGVFGKSDYVLRWHIFKSKSLMDRRKCSGDILFIKGFLKGDLDFFRSRQYYTKLLWEILHEIHIKISQFQERRIRISCMLHLVRSHWNTRSFLFLIRVCPLRNPK